MLTVVGTDGPINEASNEAIWSICSAQASSSGVGDTPRGDGSALKPSNICTMLMLPDSTA